MGSVLSDESHVGRPSAGRKDAPKFLASLPGNGADGERNGVNWTWGIQFSFRKSKHVDEVTSPALSKNFSTEALRDHLPDHAQCFHIPIPETSGV